MDAVLLARIQFGMTIGFHYIFPLLSIGLAWIIVWFLTGYLRSADELNLSLSRFWIRVFALTFAFGVATGITMQFQFGTNWAAYSRFVGDIFGAPLAAEGIFSFFLESSFLGILVYGEKRVSRGIYWFSGLMVAVGATMSAFWIVAANSWQQTPAGYILVNGRAELTDFWAAIFNPSTMVRYFHVMAGSFAVAGFFVMGVAAIYLLRNHHRKFAERSMKVGLVVAFAATMTVIFVGHHHTVQVGETQPVKLAAFEALWETQDNAPLLLVGWPMAASEKNSFELRIPGLLSLLAGGTTSKVVIGLKDFPPSDRPPVLPCFLAFHGMVALGGYFLLFTSGGLFLLWRRKLFTQRTYLRLAILSIPLPFIANELGWFAAEVGRQPWVVYNLLRTADGVSHSVPAEHILFSIILFAVIYAGLFGVWFYLLRHKINHGPQEVA